MTSEEYYSSISNWAELLDFCEENEADTCNGIFLEDDLDSHICEDIREYIQNDYWYNLRDRLDDIYANGEAYYKESTLEYICLDDDFEHYRDDVYTEMEERGFFDDDDDDDNEEEFYADYTPDELAEEEDSKYEPIEFGSLLSESKDETSKISLNNPEVGDIEAFICAAAATTPSSV